MKAVIDLGDFTPQAAVGPMRSPSGETILGRLTTTEEQRQEAVRFILAGMESAKAREGRARILWPNSDEPTTLEVTASIEHFDGRKVWLLDHVIEMLPNGAEVPPNEDARLRQLVEEVADLHDAGML